MSNPLFASSSHGQRATTGAPRVEDGKGDKAEGETVDIPSFEYTSDAALRLPLPKLSPVGSEHALSNATLPLFPTVDGARVYAEEQLLAASIGTPEPSASQAKSVAHVIPDNEVYDLTDEYTRSVLSTDSATLLRRTEDPTSSYRINDTDAVQARADELATETGKKVHMEGLYVHLDDDTKTPTGMSGGKTEELRANLNRAGMAREDKRME